MSYRQLTPEQRYQIWSCLKMKIKRSEIAREIGVDRSTITRELERNRSGRRGYNPSRAERMARGRHKGKRKYRITEATWGKVESLLKLEWSPEQISKRFKLEGSDPVSHETIYHYIYQNKQEGGDLFTHLRRRHKYRKRIHKYCKRLGWDTRRSIHERPAIVETRSRLGDWEADTIIGGQRRGAILSLVERHSRLCLLQKVPGTSARIVADAVCNKLLAVKDKVHTITSDNGIEFTRHETIAQLLDTDFFFADPYSSWQRGTNENTNGLVRQYFPKSSDFTRLSDSDIAHVTDRLNNRPRKCLGFRTPNEVFQNRFVALIT